MNGYNSTSSGKAPEATDRDGDRRPSSEGWRPKETSERAPEYGGRRKGLEPTRYGDWEKDGRCIDF